MEELKKCPFCGGEVEIKDFYLKGVANKLHYFCRCKSCGAREANKVGYRTEKRAIKGWNKMCAEVSKESVCEAKPDYESEYYRLLKLNSMLERDIGELHCQNEILRARLDMVYIIFGGKRVE